VLDTPEEILRFFDGQAEGAEANELCHLGLRLAVELEVVKVTENAMPFDRRIASWSCTFSQFGHCGVSFLELGPDAPFFNLRVTRPSRPSEAV
jgi:hypothetical protein